MGSVGQVVRSVGHKQVESFVELKMGSVKQVVSFPQQVKSFVEQVLSFVKPTVRCLLRVLTSSGLSPVDPKMFLPDYRDLSFVFHFFSTTLFMWRTTGTGKGVPGGKPW